MDWDLVLRGDEADLAPVRWVQKTILHKEVIEEELRDHQKQKEQLDHTELQLDPDMPTSGIPNPYQPPPARCVLCRCDVELDYKNTRLLSQFISPHTGQIYGRNVTGLCIYMQKRVSQLIIRARKFGFMPYRHKHPQYQKDPKLFDQYRSK